MKKIKFLAIIMAVLVILSACGKTEDKTAETTKPTPEASEQTSGQTSEQTSEEEEETTSSEDKTEEGGGGKRQVFVASDFKLTKLDGTESKLSDYDDEIIVINIWASWCMWCEKEMPDFEEFAKRDDLRVMMVNSGENKSVVEEYIEDKKYTFDVYLDPENVIAKEFGVQGLPTTIFLNNKREFLDVQSGYITKDEFDKKIDRIKEFMKKEKEKE